MTVRGGTKNEEEFQRYYDRAKKICIVLAVSLTLLFLMLSGVLLRLLGTKEEVYDMALRLPGLQTLLSAAECSLS